MRTASVVALIALVGCSQAETPAPNEIGVAAEQTPGQPSVVVLWNDAALEAARASPLPPTVVARSLHLLHAAIYEAWALHDEDARPLVLTPDRKPPVWERTDRARLVAISAAAHRVLVEQFPAWEERTGSFTSLLAGLETVPPLAYGDATAFARGMQAAEAILRDRRDDGANQHRGYVELPTGRYPLPYRPVNDVDVLRDPTRWQPLVLPLVNPKIVVVDAPGAVQRWPTPHWGAVRPFALESPDDVRAPPPPRLFDPRPYVDALGNKSTSDEAFRAQLAAVVAASDDEGVRGIAAYWSAETPPVRWNRLAHVVSARDEHALADDVKLYFALNAALFDASIAAWETKRFYDSARPITALRFLDERSTWTPLSPTPPWGEHVSEQSAFAAAAAYVLERFTGSESFAADGAPVRWRTFTAAANEAGRAARFAGLHLQDGDLRGREQGRAVASIAYEKAMKTWAGE